VTQVSGIDELPAGRGPLGAATEAAERRSARVVARSLFQLTKPRIIELLLVTTIPTMLLAARPAGGAAAHCHAGRRCAGGGQRQHIELLPRPRHRRGDAAYLSPPARREGDEDHQAG